MTTLLALETNGALIATDQAGSVAVTQSGPLRFCPAKGSRTNFAPNPRAQTNTTQAFALGASTTVTRLTTDGPRPEALTCYEVETIGGATGEGFFTSAITGQQIVPTGAKVRVAFSAKRLKGVPALTWIIQVRNAANASVESWSSTVNLTGDWQRTTLEVDVTTVNSNFIAFYLWTGASTSAVKFRISDIVFTVNDANTTPLDLAMPGTNVLHPTTGYLLAAAAGPIVQYTDAIVEPVTTNLVTNPWCNTDTTGWTYNAATGAAVTSHRWQGQRTQLVTATGANAEARFALTVPATAHTLSTRVRNLAAASRTFQLYYNGVAVGAAQTLSPGEVRRWSAPITGTATSVNAAVRCTTSVNAETFAVLHLQVEAGSIVTGECPVINDAGTIQTGFTWSGTAHASTSTRAQSVTQLAYAAGRYNASKGALLLRFRYSGPHAVNPVALFDIGGSGAGLDRFLIWITTAGRVQVYWETGAATARVLEIPTTVTADVPHEVYTEWNGTSVRASLDGGTLVTGERDVPALSASSNPFNLGTLVGGSTYPLVGAIGGILVTDELLPDTTILPTLARVPWTIASLDVPVYYPVVSTDGRLVHQTKFGAITFGIYWGPDPEGMPDWSAPFLTVARHVPGSNITKVQTLGKGALTVTYRLQLDSIEDFLALQALQGTTATLRVVGDTVTVPGTFIRVVDETFVDIPQVTLISLGNVVVMPETREVDCDAIFLKQAA